MFFQLMLTTECNLQCKYCFEEALKDTTVDLPLFEVDYGLPRTMNYDTELLNSFCRQDPNCVLIFYGGEPLLCLDRIRQIMDNVEAKSFIIQTNGLLLDHLETEYVNRLQTIFISIDGNESLTDFYRGRGTFKEIMRNLKFIKSRGFKGELIARMTVMEETDIYRQVIWLLTNRQFPFFSVHWQLNAGFWSDFGRRQFKKWIVENYDPGIRKLVKFWVQHMRLKGEVLRLYPILGLAQSLLLKEEATQLRCGAGWMNYTIQTDGYIIACPALWGMRHYYLGHLNRTSPLRLKRIPAKEPCSSCPNLRLCGGRCLYTNITKRWSTEEYKVVCDSVRNLADAIDSEIPEIRRIVEEEKIKLEAFQFTKFSGCEIIP